MRRTVLSLVLCVPVALTGALAFAQSTGWAIGRGQGGSPCSSFASLSATFNAAPGATNGIFGTPQVGESYTVAVTGAGTGTFRIVGDPAGAITYAGPTTVPGTLNFVVAGPPPPGAVGIGFFFDAGAGTVTLGASCGAFSVPAADHRGRAMLIGAIGLVALAALFGRRRKPA